MPAAALAPEPVTAASVLTLLGAIKRHGDTPAAVAFRAALARMGREAHEAGGPQALDALRREIALADPHRAEARGTILAEAWATTGGAAIGSARR